MSQLEINVTNDAKEQNFDATAHFDYSWNDLKTGYGGDFSMTAFGFSEKEARIRLADELLRFQTELVKALINYK